MMSCPKVKPTQALFVLFSSAGTKLCKVGKPSPSPQTKHYHNNNTTTTTPFTPDSDCSSPYNTIRPMPSPPKADVHADIPVVLEWIECALWRELRERWRDSKEWVGIDIQRWYCVAVRE